MTVLLKLCYRFGSTKLNAHCQKKIATHLIKRRIPPNKFDFNYLPAKKLCNDLGIN